MSWPVGLVPVLPLKNTVVFPSISQVLKVGRSPSLKAIENASQQGQWIITVAQKSPDSEDLKIHDFYSVGTLCRIESSKKLNDGSLQVVIRGVKKVSLDLSQDPQTLSFQSTLVPIEDLIDLDVDTENILMKSLLDISFDLIKPQENLKSVFNNIEDLAELGYFSAAQIDLSIQNKQKVLEISSLKDRTLEILKLFSDLKSSLEVQDDIRKKLYSRFGQNQRQQILREQMRVIQDELGDSQEGEELQYEDKIKKLQLPSDALKLAMSQAKRLSQMNNASPEFHVIKNHLDFMLSLPWNASSEVQEINIEQARQQLDSDHFGLEKIKKRILQSLSVMKLKKGQKGSILLFLGPPGVGKTSLVKSIASALNRPYVRVSLGGVRDEAEIRGHRRTYIGALPGRILNSIKKVGANNPVMLLDEIDKMSYRHSGDPANAMLEVLDPEQNENFMDHYLDTAFDLSQVMFIATANSLDGIAGPLLDRMEVIELGSYTNLEKLEIAQRYLVPQTIEEHGLSKDEFQLSQEALQVLISDFTREAGVRELKRKIAQVARHVSEKVVERREKNVTDPLPVVQAKELEDILGSDRIVREKEDLKSGPGIVAGLAWTPVGGDLLYIESAVMPGSGRLTLTGQLGDVMKESAELALSLLKSRTALWGVPFDFSKLDLHIHAPAGAIPKDGPSAGVTLITSLASLITKRSVDIDKAMTGEITLTGTVLPVGGIKEKLIAAHKRGRRKVLIPMGNERDLKNLPVEVLQDLEITKAQTVDEVLNWALGLDGSLVENFQLKALQARI